MLFLREEGVQDLDRARTEIAARDGLCAETEELLQFIERKRKSRFGRALNG